MTNPLLLDDTWLSFDHLKELTAAKSPIAVSDHAKECIIKCRNFLDDKINNTDELMYGINTGFGYLQSVSIDKEQIATLQYNLLKSHACGMGDEVPQPIVKLMLALKVKSLSYGNSGVQLSTVQRLVDMYNEDMTPVVYTQGSLGASGDLAPLSHLSLPLIGLGEVYFKGEKQPSSKALEAQGWQPIHLASKEGLALINGTQFMSAYGIHCLIKCAQLIKIANAIAAISWDAFMCGKQPLHPNIHSIRQHAGQVACAAEMMNYLQQSQLFSQPKDSLQDPYSFRCLPQVHGATADTFHYVLSVFSREINSVTDNPNIFPDDDLVLSGGNFHGQPLALALDFLSIAMSELANISERRIYQLISGQRGLPLFLVKEPGLNSGFMIPQYTAASIVSENKQLCTPASVDSISSSNNQEDHVSMGANAATKCLRVIDNVEKVLSIELMTAAQALEFRRPMQTSPLLEKMIGEYRSLVEFYEKDQEFYNDFNTSLNFIRNYSL